jgi:hypothetical protein
MSYLVERSASMRLETGLRPDGPFYSIAVPYVYLLVGLPVLEAIAQPQPCGCTFNLSRLAMGSALANTQDLIDINDLAQKAAEDKEHLWPMVISQAGSYLLTTAYEWGKEHAKRVYRDWSNPTWNFLFFCRKAGAHTGTVYVSGYEKKLRSQEIIAEWRGIRITEETHGRPLFPTGWLLGDGVIDELDPLRLLRDIERECPELFADRGIGAGSI